MTKVKLYCPDTQGTFKMMFGFAQPIKYIKETTMMTCRYIHLLNY